MKECISCKYLIYDDASKCAHCGTEQKPRRFWSKTKFWVALSAIATAFTVVYIARQTNSIFRQTTIIKRSFDLENRPYLYVDISPLAFSNREKAPNSNEEYDNLFVGAELIYKNVGKLPACNIKSEIHFYSDRDEGDNFERLKKWYIEEFGYFPEPTAVFPHQEEQKVVCKVDCSEATKDYLFTIRITYTGEDPHKIYWYATDVRYSIEKGHYIQKQQLVKLEDRIIQVPAIKEYSVYFIHSTSDYDRDGKIKMPKTLTRKEFIEKHVSK